MIHSVEIGRLQKRVCTTNPRSIIRISPIAWRWMGHFRRRRRSFCRGTDEEKTPLHTVAVLIKAGPLPHGRGTDEGKTPLRTVAVLIGVSPLSRIQTGMNQASKEGGSVSNDTRRNYHEARCAGRGFDDPHARFYRLSWASRPRMKGFQP